MSGRNLAIVASSSDDTVRELRSLLAELGLEPISTRDEAEALRLVDQKDPLLVLAEAGLAGLDGHALCARLRGDEPTRGLPIVLIGSGDGREGRLAALRAGADDFISKPLDSEDVKLVLGALLRRVQHHSGSNGTRPVKASESVENPPRPTQESYTELVSAVQDVLEQARRDDPVQIDGLRAKACELVQTMEDPHQMVALALGKRDITDLAAHHVNVSVLGLAIAKELELPEAELQRFALLGLVHDLGMVKIPSSILYAPRRLTREEFRLVAEHPRHTHRILMAAGPQYCEIADIAQQEHEREKGQGYPRGLSGDQIHELAKILGMADVYEACTHARSYRKTFIPYDALQELIEMRGDYFHPRYIKALMNALTIYPLGSYVQLNTGEVGRVRATNRKNLMRPEVELLWNTRGDRLSARRIIDLAENPFLFVSKPLYEEQLPQS